ncbi:hypothetical protein [Mucilaginibacter sp.]|jgi:hypothetical protein|uniref:hypothetical protein n=1 Tax=Mucilaginibacter sp. TaxID=1882438 RepID=UPI00261D8B44|nr:hypothetical protein [Mucilaginibacter sp.]MDB4926572.1 hypothetical protein [Mucilaginibacter sp.]
MPNYDQGFTDIIKINVNKFPLTYHYTYNFSKIKLKKGAAFWGIKVDTYNTNNFYTTGPVRPVSKIIDLDEFVKKDGASNH